MIPGGGRLKTESFIFPKPPPLGGGLVGAKDGIIHFIHDPWRGGSKPNPSFFLSLPRLGEVWWGRDYSFHS